MFYKNKLKEKNKFVLLSNSIEMPARKPHKTNKKYLHNHYQVNLGFFRLWYTFFSRFE